MPASNTMATSGRLTSAARASRSRRVTPERGALACVDFASRAIKELFPPDGPVRTKIMGEVDEEKTQKAERKRDYINWQLTEQIETSASLLRRRL